MSDTVKSQGTSMKAMVENVIDELATDSSRGPENADYWFDIKAKYVSGINSLIATLALIDASSAFKVTIDSFKLQREP
jgi:hypothetical protein